MINPWLNYIEKAEKEYLTSHDLSRAYRDLLDQVPRSLQSPRLGFILGSAQKGCIVPEGGVEIPYSNILCFPPIPGRYSAIGHEKKFSVGYFEDVETIVANGRNHYHEGYNGHEIAFLTRLMKLMGIELLVLTNAAGGLNSDYEVGDLMLIIDHDYSSLTHDQNPLICPPPDVRVVHHLPQPYYGGIYDLELTDRVKDIAEKLEIPCRTGVYRYVAGSEFEPAAKTSRFRAFGLGSVGMSTIIELIGMRGFLGLEGSDDLEDVRVLGISGISNTMEEVYDEKFDHDTLTNNTDDAEVLAAMEKIGPRIEILSRELIRDLYH